MKAQPHIFYMEDEPIVLKNRVELLESDNYRVTKAKDSEEALQAIKHFIDKGEIVNFFLLDIMITPYFPFTSDETHAGITTGLKVADYIRENYKKVYADYKIIFLTAIKGFPIKFEKLVDDYTSANSEECSIITKPIDYELLLRRLSNANAQIKS